MALHGHTPAQRKRIRRRAAPRTERPVPRQTTGGGTLKKPASTKRPQLALPRQASATAKRRVPTGTPSTGPGEAGRSRAAVRRRLAAQSGIGGPRGSPGGPSNAVVRRRVVRREAAKRRRRR